jgi:glycerophosphoryl diester phosphodiesterase
VQSFDWQFLANFHAEAPEQVLGALGPPSVLADGKRPRKEEKALSVAYLKAVVALGARVAVWSKEVSAESIRVAHDHCLKVWVYTIDDPDQANQLLDMGVDGLITNNTSLIWRALALRGFR